MAGRVFKVLPSLFHQGRRVCPGTNLPGLRFSFEDSDLVAYLFGRWCAAGLPDSDTSGLVFHRWPLVQQRASSLGVAKVQHFAARNGVVPVIPLHRHQPCAFAPTFIGPDRYARSTQPVDCVSASCASEQGSARPPAPSALVVPPDFDGLLRASPCGLVASRSRPWGSSRFQTPVADREWDMGISHATRGASTGDLFPGTLDPSKLFPCTQPSSG
jgi:hypothetical protein